MATTVKLSDLTKEQIEIAGWIDRFWNNLYKLGKEKRTRPVLETRQKKLDEYWVDFLDYHRSIKRADPEGTSDYLKNDQFSITEKRYLSPDREQNSKCRQKGSHCAYSGR